MVYKYTGTIATFTPTISGKYEFIASGGAGGSIYSTDVSVTTYAGGLGAVVTTTTTLTAGTVVNIVVGGTGAASNTTGCAGGGASAVYINCNYPVVIAGGGSGAAPIYSGSYANTTLLSAPPFNDGSNMGTAIGGQGFSSSCAQLFGQPTGTYGGGGGGGTNVNDAGGGGGSTGATATYSALLLEAIKGKRGDKGGAVSAASKTGTMACITVAGRQVRAHVHDSRS